VSDSSFERWRALVDKGLKGAPFESLTATTLEGIPIAPLYTERDRPAAEGIPWATRAERAMGPMMLLRDGLDLEAERRGGATAVHLWLPGGGPHVIDVPDGLVVLVDGPFHHAAATSSAKVRSLGDPWAEMRTPAETPSRSGTRPRGDAAIDLVADALGRDACALGASAAFWSLWHRADAVESIALGVASLVESLRRLEARGVDLGRAVERTTFAIDVDTDFFLEIAKLRAARRLLARVLSASGISARPLIAAHTSERSRASHDTSTNLVRFTLGAAAALTGGADVVCVRPHAWSQDPAAVPTETARKVPLVLALESHLAAAADPSRGSAYLETLTEALAARAWEWFREIEAGGGIAQAYPMIFEHLARSREKLERATATRKRPLVGVSRFPLPGAVQNGNLLGQAYAFESLAARGAPCFAQLTVLPGCPEARVDFAREVAQLCTSRVVDGETVSTRHTIAFLCAADTELGTKLPELARALRATGVGAIVVAGKPGAHEQVLRDAGADAFVYVGADLVATLSAVVDRVAERLR
jgi:methylmalonyl-CoA mutase